MERDREHRYERDRSNRDKRSTRDVERDRSSSRRRDSSRERDSKGYRDWRRERNSDRDRNRRNHDSNEDRRSSNSKREAKQHVIQVSLRFRLIEFVLYTLYWKIILLSHSQQSKNITICLLHICIQVSDGSSSDGGVEIVAPNLIPEPFFLSS